MRIEGRSLTLAFANEASPERGLRPLLGFRTTMTRPAHAAWRIWAVWRDGPRLGILNSVIELGSPPPHLVRVSPFYPNQDVSRTKGRRCRPHRLLSSNHSPTHAIRAIADTDSPTSPSAGSSAVVMGPTPSIDGPNLGSPGSLDTWSFPTASPHAIVSGVCSSRWFQRCFRAWVAEAIVSADECPDRLVAIDGDTCRGSRHAAKVWADGSYADQLAEWATGLRSRLPVELEIV